VSFLVVKPDYPHAGVSNALFSIEKGQVLECPEGYEPPSSVFSVFETEEEARQFIEELKKASAREAEPRPSPAYRPFPLFRRVQSVEGAHILQLFDRDVYQFLSREWQDVVIDINVMKMDRGSLERLLECEKIHFNRQDVINAIEDRIERAPKAKKVTRRKKEKAKTEAKAPGVTTKGFKKPKVEAKAEAEVEAQDKDETEPSGAEESSVSGTPYTPPSVEPELPTFREQLLAVSGIGKATADDVLAVFPDLESLQKAIRSRKKLPFRNDVAKLLRQNFSLDKIEKQ